MEFFRIKNDIPFMRHALKFNIISLVTFLLAVFFLLTKGLHLSVEFTGGTLIEVRYEQAADLEKIRSALGKSGFSDYSVQNFGSSQDVMIRLPLKGEQKATRSATRSWRRWPPKPRAAASNASSSSARRLAKNSPRTAPWPCWWSSSASSSTSPSASNGASLSRRSSPTCTT